MGKVWLMILEDRHTDVEVKVYATPERAMAAAREIVESYDYSPDEPDKEIAGWLFYATLSGEGGMVRVQEAPIQA